MNEISIILVSLGAVGFFILGVPIVLCIGVWCIFVSIGIDFPIANIGVTAFEGLNSYAILAMPIFILTGDLVSAGGIARRFTEFAHAALGWMRGALGLATLAACGMFAAISGSNSATTAAIGSIMCKEMKRDGYDEKFAAATAASGGTVGIIIPPSIIFIIYGYMMDLSISDLFLSGILPGMLMVIFMMIPCHILSKINRWGNLNRFSLKETMRSAWSARLGFVAIVVILYGIYTGKFSPTEAAGIAAGYCWLAGAFLTRGFKLRETPKIMLRSGQIAGLIVPVVAVSVMMQQILSALGAKEIITASVTGLGGYYAKLCGIMIILLLAGMIMESLPITIIFAPILAPIAHGMGMDPIHFGCVFLVGTAIGFITPPFGLNLFVISGITGIPYMRLLNYAFPYFCSLMAAWIIMTIFPWFALVFIGK